VRLRWAAVLAVVCCVAAHAADDPLPSWNDGTTKQAIVRFVGEATRAGSPTFVPPDERIATFDNDGTLWVEQPMYTQFVFAIDRVKALAPQHPDWKTTLPFSAALDGDMKTLLAQGEKGMVAILAATHAGNTTEEFSKVVTEWTAAAKHPRFQHLYTECVYQPMLELMAWLRAEGFKTYIVSGGGAEFMRPWTQRVYGIPPEQVVGSTIVTTYQMRPSGPVLFREPKVDYVDDGPGKAVSINRYIGRRPVLAFGNSDGDHQMLQWTAAGGGRRLIGLVHHTDAQREWAYDRQSHIGKLDKALDEAQAKGWTVVDMKKDWKRIYPFDK
jgi:phosphoserine phosphatase